MRLLIALLALMITVNSAFTQDTSHVYFDFDRFTLSAEAKEHIQGIASKPNLYSLHIYGHTDQIGSNEYNEWLSLKRAQAVKDHFISSGIRPEKIQVVRGFGEDKPAIDQLDAASRRANRRVVIVADYELRSTDSVIIDEHSEVLPPQQPSAQTPTGRPKESLIEELTDTATRAGDNLILRNINFYGGRHVFLPESYPALHELLYAMQTFPTLEIEIQGHICCLDHPGDGLDIDTGEPHLSFNRAKAVYDYLATRGIDPKRMTYKGFGHRYPIIAFERTDEERTTNRRVEIKILKK